MEMWQQQSTLLLLTVALMVVSALDPVILDKDLKSVEHPSGSPMIFRCGLNTKNHTRFRVSFYFNTLGSSFNNSRKLSEIIFITTTNTTTVVYNKVGKQEALTYTLLNATASHRGWYFCKVELEIPYLASECSNGTEVIIAKAMEHTTYPLLTIVTSKPVTPRPSDGLQLLEWWMWMLLAVSAFLLFFLLVVCIWMRRKYRRRREEDPIYANTHRATSKQPSPRPGTPGEKLKTVSSSQHLRSQNTARKYENRQRGYRQ